ncbi:hypothetical protein EV174_004112, partial [Coemansia sp. RSA 2320]
MMGYILPSEILYMPLVILRLNTINWFNINFISVALPPHNYEHLQSQRVLDESDAAYLTRSVR